MSEQRITREQVDRLIESHQDHGRMADCYDAVEFGRALLRLDDALKSGCVGCQLNYSLVEESLVGPLGIHEIGGPGGETAYCSLNPQQRAARLPREVSDA